LVPRPSIIPQDLIVLRRQSRTDPQYLTDSLTNKGTAFTADERRRLRLEGRLPPRVESLEEQAARVLANLRAKGDLLERYRYLSAVQCENETLFYRVVLDHLEETLPIIYTPTVGQACLAWSRLYERPRGLYISAAQHTGRIADLLRQWPRRPGIIVVTDGGRILGLGDLGANGMGIPIGKLALYTACAGVPPAACLPVALDVGTDVESIRDDVMYLGDRRARLSGAPYDAFLEEFITATQEVFPGAVVQFEDFNNACAFRLLRRYRDQLCCFNDDMQGTGAMGLAGLYSAARITGRPLRAQRILFAGAGEACLGIGAIVVAAMQREGLSEAEARARCLFIDSKGPIVTSRSDLAEPKRLFAQQRRAMPGLVETIDDFRPTALIGASTQGGLFTQPVLAAMARLNEHPVIFALSNPTANSECTAEQAYAWTSGRAVFASGSPFAPVTFNGRVHATGQANNSFVFPGVGFGLLLSGTRRVDDEIFFAAGRALADQVTDADLQEGRIFPALTRMRDVALAVATAVATVAYDRGLAANPQPVDLAAATAGSMYTPQYRPLSREAAPC
jgi:malate dehydrogenase (oxaloacetate-decarboxylating)(NADP+)